MTPHRCDTHRIAGGAIYRTAPTSFFLFERNTDPNIVCNLHTDDLTTAKDVVRALSIPKNERSTSSDGNSAVQLTAAISGIYKPQTDEVDVHTAMQHHYFDDSLFVSRRDSLQQTSCVMQNGGLPYKELAIYSVPLQLLEMVRFHSCGRMAALAIARLTNGHPVRLCNNTSTRNTPLILYLRETSGPDAVPIYIRGADSEGLFDRPLAEQLYAHMDKLTLSAKVRETLYYVISVYREIYDQELPDHAHKWAKFHYRMRCDMASGISIYEIMAQYEDLIYEVYPDTLEVVVFHDDTYHPIFSHIFNPPVPETRCVHTTVLNTVRCKLAELVADGTITHEHRLRLSVDCLTEIDMVVEDIEHHMVRHDIIDTAYIAHECNELISNLLTTDPLPPKPIPEDLPIDYMQYEPKYGTIALVDGIYQYVHTLGDRPSTISLRARTEPLARERAHILDDLIISSDTDDVKQLAQDRAKEFYLKPKKTSAAIVDIMT